MRPTILNNVVCRSIIITVKSHSLRKLDLSSVKCRRMENVQTSMEPRGVLFLNSKMEIGHKLGHRLVTYVTSCSTIWMPPQELVNLTRMLHPKEMLNLPQTIQECLSLMEVKGSSSQEGRDSMRI